MPCCWNANFLPHCKNAEFAYLQPLCCILFVQMINYISEHQKWLKNALFWRIFVGTTKNAKMKHAIYQQRSLLWCTKYLEAHLHPPSTTPPIACWRNNPTLPKNFLFFSQKTRLWWVSKKTKLFLFIYFSFYNIYII